MKNRTNKLLSLLLAAVLLLACAAPALALNENLTDGKYSISGTGYTTNMFAPDESDFNSYVIVKDTKAYLVTRSYAPNKYDAVWVGKRSVAPEDPLTADVIQGTFIPDENDEYKTNGTYKDNVYNGNKAVQFVIPLTADDLTAGKVYFVLRRASWSSSNAGKWMGNDDHNFDFGTLTKQDETTTTTFGFTLQVGQYTEGADFHTASFEGVTYALKDAGGTAYQPSNATSGMLTYSGLDASKTYTFTATKEGWTVCKQGEWDTDAHAYEYIFLDKDEISVTITSADAGKNITDSTNPGLIFRLKPKEATVLDDALALVPKTLSIFTTATADAVSAAVKAADTTETDETALQQMADAVTTAVKGLVPKDGSYTAGFELTGSGMFKIIDPISLDVENGVMSFRFVNGSKTYTKLYIGTTDAANAAAESDLILPGEEATASNGKAGYNWTVPVSALQTEIPVAAYSKSKSTFNSTGNFLIPANSLVRTDGTGPVDLTITNNTGMFRAVSASYYDGVLTMALNGTGYSNLYKGTYEEAVANGDKIENWIKATTNSAGKLEFAIPVAEGETYVPVVAISNSYYEKYQAGENPLARAFYPRQLELDLTATTLVTGDYDHTATLTVTNNVKMFKVTDTAELHTVGGPNSNNYKVELQLTMGSTSFDKAFVGTMDAAAAAEATVAIDENQGFTLEVTGITDSAFVASFHSVKNDEWYERQFTVDAAKATLVIDPVEENSSSGNDNDSGSGNDNNSGTSDVTVDTSMYSKGTFTDVPFSIERAATGDTWHNVALPTCTVYVENGAIYIDFTMERADRSKAPEYAWAETSVGRVNAVIDNEALTCSFNRLPVPSLGRVEVSMMTTAMSSAHVVDYVMIIDDSAILISGSPSVTPSGSSEKTDTATKTVTNDDGSVTEITTNADGSTTAVTTYDDGRTIETDTAADGSVFEVKKDAEGKVTEASATISERALAAATEAGEPVTLALELPVAKDADEAAPLTVELPDGTDSAVVEIPVTDVSNTSVIILVNADGTEEILPRTALTEDGLMVTLPAGATVKVVDNKQTFDDMPTDAEEAEAIEFVAARGLMNGVGNGEFAPELPMSRAMIATVLYRMERKPDATSAADFTDVADGEWYSEAIAWAAEAGIVQGYGDSFGVNDPVTTEQLIVMMWRMSGKPAAKIVETGANDWAKEAMSWALSVGLIGEESTGANAGAPATRGSVAVLVERFINLG